MTDRKSRSTQFAAFTNSERPAKTLPLLASSRTQLLVSILVLLCCAVFLPLASAQSWSNGYSYRRTITIDHTQVPNTDQSNFPLVLSGIFPYLRTTTNGGNVANASGYDIIFTSDSAGSTPLTYERGGYDSTSGSANFWVKIPTLSHTSDTVIYMFYGKSSVTTDQSSGTGVWDSNYVGVWHLPDGSTLSTNDSTSNGNNGTNYGATAATGKIDGGAALDGNTEYVDIPLTVNYSGITVEAWFNASTVSGGNDCRIVANAHTDWDVTIDEGFQLMFHDGGESGFFDVGNGSTDGSAAWSTSLSPNTWYHYVGTYDGSTVKSYINGTEVGSDSMSGSIVNSGYDVNIGRNPVYMGDNFPGTVDEIRISNVARSSDWIAAEYNNQKTLSSFLSVGGAQIQSNSYTYQRTITIDHTKVPNTDQSNFPVLISGTYSYLETTTNGGNVTSANGYDIIFTSDSAGLNLLDFERESYDPSSGSVNFWVKIPTVSHSSDSVIYMFYGNSSVTTDQSNSTGAWDSNYAGVWHFPDGTTLSTADSTPNGNVGGITMPAPTATTGQIGGGMLVNGYSEAVGLRPTPSLQSGDALTVSTWVNTSALNDTSQALIMDSESFPSTGFALADNGQYSEDVFFRVLPAGSNGNCGEGMACVARSAVNDGNWHYLVGVYDGTTVKLYLDGAQQDSEGATSYTPNTSDFVIVGGFLGNAGSSKVDETRFSASARSADWISTEFNNQSSPSTFYAIGSAGPGGGGPTISSLSPTSGAAGLHVTISGSGFGSSQGTSSVAFNGTSATPTSWTATQIVAPVPSGATTGDVVVTVGGANSNGMTFTVVAYALSSISVTPSSPSITTGNTQQLAATGYYNDGTSADLTGSATWTSSSTSVATIASGGLSTAVAVGETTVTATVGSISGTALLDVASIASTGTMSADRQGQTATLLEDGTVLLAGGYDNTGAPLSSAEIYDPSAGTFSSTGSMSAARGDHTATLLNDGTVLVAGGYDDTGTPLGSAEIFNPSSGTFTATGGLVNARAGQTATLLTDGSVLFAGGYDTDYDPLANAELYSPATSTFAGIGSMAAARSYQTATLLNDGSVLIAGGYDDNGNSLSSAEIYDPTSRTFAGTGNLTTSRANHTATLLNGGKVLLAGGITPTLASAELYDPTVGTFSATGSMATARAYHSAILLNDGTVFVAGGYDTTNTPISSVELYNPTNGTFTSAANMSSARVWQTTTLLNSGKVLIAGGIDATFATVASAELYQPGSLTPANLLSIALSPTTPSVSGGVTQALVATGTFSDSTTQVLSSAAWSSSDSTKAIVSNDSSNRGHAYAVASGSPTISACTGSVCGSTTLTVSSSGLLITDVSPSTASVGSTVIISGTGFGSSQGSSSVKFNGTTTTASLWSTTGIVVTVPSGATTGNVVVNVSSTDSNGMTFAVNSAPSITSLSPTSGSPGTPVTITGSNFGSGRGQAVTFNGVDASISSWSDTSISVFVPAGASTGNVIVTAASGASSSGSSFIVPNIVTGISPSTGPVGTIVNILGTGFGAVQGSNTVSFNGTSATVTSWSATSITVTVPSGATTGNAVVTVSSTASNGVTFTVLATPSITSLSPTTGPPGTSVTITGTNFGATQGTSYVSFNGLAGIITSWSSTSIVATVPSGATTGNVVVTLAGVNSNGSSFTVTAPTLSSIAVTPAGPYVLPGGTLQFVATGTYADASTQDLSATATWSSGTTGVATISSTGLITAVSAGTSTIQATVGSVNGTTALNVAATAPSGSLNGARDGQTATILTDGRVLILGGITASSVDPATTEIYDPITSTFTPVGLMSTARYCHTATLLNNGKVLIVGGFDSNGNTLGSAEIFDPAAGTFTATGNMSTLRGCHTATLLNDGNVLVTGGYDGSFNVLASAELYSSATGAFASVGSMTGVRAYQTATLLNNGKVLIAGGYDESTNPLATAEVFDPSTRSFASTTGNLNTARSKQNATLLNDGTVLITGGLDGSLEALASAELYDPTGNSFSATGSMGSARVFHSETLLNNGTVLVTGGTDFEGSVFPSTEVYDPTAASFTFSDSLHNGRFSHTATLLNNGLVVVVGGIDNDFAALASVELYQPGSFTPPNLVSIALTPSAPTISAGTAEAFTATGTFGDSSTQVLSSVTWTSSDNTKATITSDSTNHGHAFGVASGSITVSACTGTTCGTTTLTVSSSALAITELSPPSGPVGSTVIVSGTGFGSSQGASTVNFNGTAATVSLWSSTGIIVTVPSGATTGNVVVTVSSANSNGMSFTVGSAPLITGLSPLSGAPGTSVILTGSSFGSSQGSSTVTFNGVAATVTSWSNTSITATVPSLASTGMIVVTLSSAVSNGAEFMVPAIYSLTPPDAPVAALITIAGTGFGSTQGTNTVTIGSTAMQVISWTDSQILAAVATGSVTGALDIHEGSSTISGPTFSIDGSFPYTVAPQNFSMLVGQSRTISAMDGNTPQVGLRWITTNSSVVSLSMDDPPVLTATGTGTVTVYAGIVPVVITVYAGSSLPTNTTIWSQPLGSGLNLQPAIPSNSGIDVFSANQSSGQLTAMSSDGTILWSGTYPGILGVVPDFTGSTKTFINTYNGLLTDGVCHFNHYVRRLDPTTGENLAFYTFPDRYAPDTVCFVDGTEYYTVYTDDYHQFAQAVPDTTGMLFIQDNAVVSLMNPLTQDTLATVTLDQSTYDGTDADPVLGQLIVAGDGNAYVPYIYFVSTTSGDDVHIVSTLMLLRMSPDGSYTKTQLQQLTADSSDSGLSGNYYEGFSPGGAKPTIFPFAITNAAAGVAIFEAAPVCGGACTPEALLTFVSQDAVTAQTDMTVRGFAPVLQREDGSYVGTTFNGLEDTDDNLLTAIAPSGSTLWQQNVNPTSGGGTTQTWPLYATDTGGVVARSGTNRYTLDKDGVLVSQTADNGAILSWIGNVYINVPGAVERAQNIPTHLAQSWQGVAGGNHSQQGTSVHQEWYPQLDSCFDMTLKVPVSCPGPREQIYNAYKTLITRIGGNETQIQSHVLNQLSNSVGNFVGYLNAGFSAYDGTRSNAPVNKTLNRGILQFLLLSGTVGQEFASGTQHAATLPIYKPLSTFFDPRLFDPSLNGANLTNMGTVFHEAFHGFTGITDSKLQGALSCTVQDDTTNISTYLSQFLTSPPPDNSALVPCTPP